MRIPNSMRNRGGTRKIEKSRTISNSNRLIIRRSQPKKKIPDLTIGDL